MSLKIHGFLCFLLFSRFLCQISGARIDPQQQSKDKDDDHLNIINIGIIVDMGSSMGKLLLSCVNIAISDANAVHEQNRTRIVLHTRDSAGEPFTALAAAEDLLKSIKVESIIVPATTSESSMMATLADKANVPMLSFTSSPLSSAHPYFLQITEEEKLQFEAIIALLEAFKWKNIVLIHEHIDDGRNILPHLIEEFQEKEIHVVYKNAISLSENGMEELEKLKMLQTSVFVVHTSPSLASKIFLNLKKLGMMNEGYAWLVTSKTMNFLASMDPWVIESMQGVLGLKSYIPISTKLQNFTWRWRNEVQHVVPYQEIRDLNIQGIRAYDTVWALAYSFARLRSKLNFTGLELLNEISKSKFRGLGGDFQFVNGKIAFERYEVVNVIGKGERKVGFWTLANGFTKDIPLVNGLHDASNFGLETIVWPGISTNTPKGWSFQARGKRLKIVFPTNGLSECIDMQHDNQSNITIVTGFCKDVFDAAIKSLGYTLSYDLIPFINVDRPSAASYDDLIYQVYLKKYDAAIGDITITSNRSSYVDFTLPFTDLGVGTVVRLNTKSRWFFLEPLDQDLWITVACFFVLLGIIVWLLEHPINEEFQGSRAQQIATAFWFSISTLVYAHRENLESNLSKFVVGVWLFVVFILASSYTAILSSILTVQQIQLAKGDTIGFVAGSILRGAIFTNLNFGDDAPKTYDSVEKISEALSKGSKNGGVAAIIDEIPYIKLFLARYSSDYVLKETSSITNGFGFAFQKGSPLVPEISRAIAKLREEGTLLKLEKNWYKQGKKESTISAQSTYEHIKPQTLSLNDFLGLFFLSGLSKIIALLVLLIFFLRKRLSLKRRIFGCLVEGKFAFIMNCLSPRMANDAIVVALPAR